MRHIHLPHNTVMRFSSSAIGSASVDVFYCGQLPADVTLPSISLPMARQYISRETFSPRGSLSGHNECAGVGPGL